MSLKYVDETSLQENILKTKQHVESVRSALDSAKQNKMQFSTMPTASEDYLGAVVIYTGATTNTYTHGYVYECVSDGGNPATYTWEQRNVQDRVAVDGVTIVKDANTDEISAVTATNSTKGIVKGSADVSIDADGAMTVKDRVKEVNALPTASVDLLDECYLLRSVQTGYDLGKIYQCQAIEVVPEGTENPSEEGWYELDGTTYELSADTSVDAGKTYYEIKWVSISSANLEAGRGITIEGSVINANTNTFTGTQAEWDELSTEEKKEYDIANITDDGETGDITDVVESGNHNPVESDAVYNSEQTIFEVMGEMGAKNLLPFPYYEFRSSINGVTCVINSDGSVTFNGTATNKIYFNCTFTEKIVDFGNVSFDSKITSDAPYIATLENGSDDVYLSYNSSNKITSININSGTVCNNLTVYPMIRLASDTDNTFQPYAKPNTELTKDDSGLTDNMFANGAVNILPNNATSGIGDGIEYTVNNDGSVTVNGTNTGVDQFFPILVSTVGLKGENSHFSGCPANGTLTTYAIRIENYTKSKVYHDFGEGVDVSLSENEGIRVNIMIRSGATINNLTFKPMLTLADVPNSDYNHYVPYAKSNSILTEDISDLQDDIAGITDNINKLGAKNLIPFPYDSNSSTINGVTFTINDNGSVTVNGTATADAYFYLKYHDATTPLRLATGAKYIFSGLQNSDGSAGVANKCVMYLARVNGALAWINSTSPVSDRTFTITTAANNTLAIYVKNGETVSNFTFYPMIRLASIEDATYVPYAKSNKELTEDVADLQNDVDGITDNMFENGCVNLCPITITSQTVDTGGTDVTITVNNDGTFTVNGTVTNTTQVNVTDVLANILEGGKQYNLSGSPIGSTSETFCLYISASGGGYDEGDGFSFNLEQLSSGARVRLVLYAGQTLSDVTFKPMITLADVPNSDYAHYVPYAKSNKELTEVVSGTVLQNGLAITITYTPTNDESWQSRLYHLYEKLQSFQNTLESDEKFTVTNLNLGTSALWANHANAFYQKNSIIGDDFFAVYGGTTQMVIRTVRLEPTEANNRFSKTVITYSNNVVECTNESAAVGTNPVSLRIVKYKVNS